MAFETFEDATDHLPRFIEEVVWPSRSVPPEPWPMPDRSERSPALFPLCWRFPGAHIGQFVVGGFHQDSEKAGLANFMLSRS